MDRQYRSFDTQIKSINEDERSLTALVTTAARDRTGEVLDPEGADLKNFRKNPVVLLSHNYSQPPIGRALWIKKSKEGILSKVQFAETQIADDVYNLYKGGFMKAFSVGFVPKEWEDGDGDKTPNRTYKKWELVEYSAVPVPANPEALALALKKGVIKSDVWKKDLSEDYLRQDGAEKIKDTEITVTWRAEDGTTSTSKMNIEPEEKDLEDEVTLKPEENEETIRIPVRECKVTATIDISKSKGIKALYCGDIKKVRTYLFAKSKGWTMAKAKQWVKDHDGKELPEGVTKEKATDEQLEALTTEINELTQKYQFEKEANAELRYRLYLALNESRNTLSEITDGDISKKITDILDGVIRKVTGKISS